MTKFKKLSDAEWVNVVNNPEVLACGGGQEAAYAVAKAFNLIEDRLIQKNQPILDAMQSRINELEQDAERWKEVAFGSSPFLGVVYVDDFSNERWLVGQEAIEAVDVAIKLNKE